MRVGIVRLARRRVRVVRQWPVVLLLAVAPSFACTLFTDLDSLSEPSAAPPVDASADAPDARTLDANVDREGGPQADAANDGTAGVTIKDGLDDCSAWSITGATVATQTTGNKSGRACRLCATGALPAMSMVRTFVPVVVGARYDATVYVRGTTSDPPAKNYLFALASVNGGARGESRGAVVQDVFIELRVSHVALDGAKSLEVTVAAEGVNAGECMVVDSLSIVR